MVRPDNKKIGCFHCKMVVMARNLARHTRLKHPGKVAIQRSNNDSVLTYFQSSTGRALFFLIKQ